MSALAPPRRGLVGRGLDRLAAIDDGNILRVAFLAMLAGTMSVLFIDYRELVALDGSVTMPPALPLVPVFPGDMPGEGSHGPAPMQTTDRALLEAPMALSLEAGGVLKLTGTIDPGAVERFTSEIAARGEYVTTIALDSPGGSVRDAIAIGSAIRAGGFATAVGSGALCASSCPLILAGGVTRSVAADAGVGVHQIYVAAPVSDVGAILRDVGGAMYDAQKTTAVVTRYLIDMGIDPALWIHALETPPQELYFLSTEELSKYRLSLPTGSAVSDDSEVKPPVNAAGA
ncbi:MAG: hypothetical protein JWR75_1580 [Devosia sp.]|nr:hypothetical protein [Devosia sp.]